MKTVESKALNVTKRATDKDIEFYYLAFVDHANNVYGAIRIKNEDVKEVQGILSSAFINVFGGNMMLFANEVKLDQLVFVDYKEKVDRDSDWYYHLSKKLTSKFLENYMGFVEKGRC